jgi:hypothetical protein
MLLVFAIVPTARSNSSLPDRAYAFAIILIATSNSGRPDRTLHKTKKQAGVDTGLSNPG